MFWEALHNPERTVESSRNGGAPVRVDNDDSDVEGDDDDDDDDVICLLTASLCRPGQFRCGDGLCVDGSRCLHFNLIQSI